MHHRAWGVKANGTTQSGQSAKEIRPMKAAKAQRECVNLQETSLELATDVPLSTLFIHSATGTQKALLVLRGVKLLIV